MVKKQLSVEIEEEQLTKLNMFCLMTKIKQKEAVSSWIDSLPEYVAKE